MLMDFYLENLTQGLVMQLPMTPETYEIQSETTVETVKLVAHGDINIPTYSNPKAISLTGTFSTNEDHYLNKNWIPQLIHCTADYVNVINSWRLKHDIIRVLIVPRGTIESRLDARFYIKSLKINGDDEVTGDINYTIEFVEYVDLNNYNTVTTRSVSASKSVNSTIKTNNNTTTKQRTYTVKKGDSLWSIARKYYGNGTKYTIILNANKSKIKNKNLIYIGQVFVIP